MDPKTPAATPPGENVLIARERRALKLQRYFEEMGRRFGILIRTGRLDQVTLTVGMETHPRTAFMGHMSRTFDKFPPKDDELNA